MIISDIICCGKVPIKKHKKGICDGENIKNNRKTKPAVSTSSDNQSIA